LSNFLVGETPIENAVLRTEHENLWFLPSGGLPTDPAGLLNTKKMSDMIAEMKRRFDFIFIDAPPILGASDASVIAREADMTMIIVQHRKLAEKTLLRVKQGIESAGGTIAGVVMNNVDVRSDSQYSYYTSYYSYYATLQGPTVHSPPAQPLAIPQQAYHQPPQTVQPQTPANAFASPTPHPQYPFAPQQQPQQQQPQPQQFQQQAYQNPQRIQPQEPNRLTDVY
jgi:Mrp family chromosome partitioning ATPase